MSPLYVVNLGTLYVNSRRRVIGGLIDIILDGRVIINVHFALNKDVPGPVV